MLTQRLKRKKKGPARRPPPRTRPAARPTGQASAQAQPESLKGKAGGALEAAPRLLVYSLLFLLVLYAAALLFLRPASPGRALSFDEVLRNASSRQVKAATFLDHDARVVGTLRRSNGTEQKFWASYPRSDAATNDLLKSLVAGGTKVDVDLQPGKQVVRFLAQFLLPLVVLANLFALLFTVSRGAGRSPAAEFSQFGRVGDKRLASRERTKTTFAEVAAADEAITELREVRDYLANPRAFEQMGALPPKGVLLVGAPGCGKTLLARAVAGEAKANFYSISGSEFVESLVGVGAARVRDLFRQARSATPSIIFIDELDAVGRQRGAGVGGGHDEREQTLNEMLVQMDGFSPSEGVVVMAATNRPDILDPALLRAGRFDRHITVERPDLDGRLSILRLHARHRRLADPETDLAWVARHTSGFSGADLANLLNEAALLAVRGSRTAIGRPELEEAVERVLAGPRRKPRIISAEEKRRIALHEAGHAVVAAATGKGEDVQKLSIIARGRGIGHLAVLQGDRTVLTRSEMEGQVRMAMAGIAAEELVLGEPSTGSEQDLERATYLARDMAGRFGMSPRLGRARVLHQHGEVFLGRDYLQTKDVSQPTLEDLDSEVRRILAAEEEAATAILTANRRILDELAAELAELETLQRPSLEARLGKVKPYVGRPEVAPNGPPPSRARR